LKIASVNITNLDLSKIVDALHQTSGIIVDWLITYKISYAAKVELSG
jgi:hypothetical protein